jgi:hypothetical protein
MMIMESDEMLLEEQITSTVKQRQRQFSEYRPTSKNRNTSKTLFNHKFIETKYGWEMKEKEEDDI